MMTTGSEMGKKMICCDELWIEKPQNGEDLSTKERDSQHNIEGRERRPTVNGVWRDGCIWVLTKGNFHLFTSIVECKRNLYGAGRITQKTALTFFRHLINIPPT